MAAPQLALPAAADVRVVLRLSSSRLGRVTCRNRGRNAASNHGRNGGGNDSCGRPACVGQFRANEPATGGRLAGADWRTGGRRAVSLDV